MLCVRYSRPTGYHAAVTFSILVACLQVTTNPLPLREDLHRRNTDWRTDPVLLLYNAIALDVMQSAGIEVVNTWNLAAPLAELSYDRAHYKGVVGYYISLLLLNIVCSSA